MGNCSIAQTVDDTECEIPNPCPDPNCACHRSMDEAVIKACAEKRKELERKRFMID